MIFLRRNCPWRAATTRGRGSVGRLMLWAILSSVRTSFMLRRPHGQVPIPPRLLMTHEWLDIVASGGAQGPAGPTGPAGPGFTITQEHISWGNVDGSIPIQTQGPVVKLWATLISPTIPAGFHIITFTLYINERLVRTWLGTSTIACGGRGIV